MEELIQWLEANRLNHTINDKVVEIRDFGKLFFIEEKDGEIMEADLTFKLSDEETEFLLNDDEVKFIIFKWGSRFYYCKKEETKGQFGVAFVPEFDLLVTLGTQDNDFDSDFVNLGIHTGYELLNGSGDPEKWVKKAKFYNQKAIAICDKNTLAGTLPMQLACEKYQIKCIHGLTATIAYDYSELKEHQDVYELKLYAKNKEGWHNLLMVNKAINVDYDGFCPEHVLKENSEGLICVFGRESILNFFINKSEKAINIIESHQKIFGKKNTYFQFDFSELSDDTSDIKNLENTAVYIKKYLKYLKPVYIQDTYYIEKMDSEIKTLLNGVSKIGSLKSNDQYFKSIDDLLTSNFDLFSDELHDLFLKSISNSVSFAEKCNFSIDIGDPKIPKFEVDDPIAFYHEKLSEGFNRKVMSKYGHDEDKIRQYLDRLDAENEVIVGAGFVDYFLILYDIIGYARSEKILVGPGRGSAGGSLVAYLLDIIQIDPIEFNLLFERFLNKTRSEKETVFEVKFENGKRAEFRLGEKIINDKGEEISITEETDFKDIEIDVDKTKIKWV